MKSSLKNRVSRIKEAGGGMQWRRWFRALIKHLFAPVHTIGDKRRARGVGEQDEDEKHLGVLNREWDKMLREDEWMVKLMTHVRPLQLYTLIAFIIFILLGVYFQLPARHWGYVAVLCFVGLTLPYWAWIGGWYSKIVKKVFAKFKERFGKHFHLK